jgi:hypothetical protein
VMDPKICRHCLRPEAITMYGFTGRGGMFVDHACLSCRAKVIIEIQMSRRKR